MGKFRLDEKKFEQVVDVINTFDTRLFKHRFPGEFVRTGRNVWSGARLEWGDRRDLIVNYIMRSFVAQNAVLGMCINEPQPMTTVARSMARLMAMIEERDRFKPYMVQSSKKLLKRLEKAGAIRISAGRVYLEVTDPIYFQERCIYSHMDHPLGLHAVRRMLTLCTVTVRDEVVKGSVNTIALDYHNLKSIDVTKPFINRIISEYLNKGYLSETESVIMETHKKVISDRYAESISKVCPSLSDKYARAIRRLLAQTGIVSIPMLRALIYSDTSIDREYGSSADAVRNKLLETIDICTRRLVRENMIAKEGSLIIPYDIIKMLRLFEPEATLPVHTLAVERIMFHSLPSLSSPDNPLEALIDYIQSVRSVLSEIYGGVSTVGELLSGRDGYERVVVSTLISDLQDMGYLSVEDDGSLDVNYDYFKLLAKLFMAIPPYV